MKTTSFIRNITLLVSACMLMTINLAAQDMVKTNPKHVKLLTDTLGVRMVKVTMAPGDELTLHTHPVQMVYCLEGGEITVTYKDGKKEVMKMKAGESMQAPPELPHVTKNTGTTKISFLEIEIAEKKK
jgi:quercetin dioxygenase-like cupin family protein